MTEQPQAAPPAPKQPAPQQQEDAQLAAARERVEKLRAQLAEAEAALPPDPGTVKVRVAGKHDSFTRGAVTVTREFTPVPAGALAGLLGAAADAGVTIEEA